MTKTKHVIFEKEKQDINEKMINTKWQSDVLDKSNGFSVDISPRNSN